MIPLTQSLTFDLNDGDMVVTAEIAPGAVDGGWGISRLEVLTTTPIQPDFLPTFLEAAAEMVLNGGLSGLLAAHEPKEPS